MLLHNIPFRFIQRTAFGENLIGCAYFSHIMHRRKKMYVIYKIMVDFRMCAADKAFLAQFSGIGAHALDMISGIVIFELRGF